MVKYVTRNGVWCDDGEWYEGAPQSMTIHECEAEDEPMLYTHDGTPLYKPKSKIGFI